MKKLLFSLVFTLFCLGQVSAQEFNATVKVLTPQLQKTDRKVFDVLETSLRDFINNYKWTEDVFEPTERIHATFTITVSTEMGSNAFEAKLAVQATRPIFGSTYETALISHQDDNVNFAYEQYQAIDFSRDNIDNNLTAVLAFYCYTILGLDYDTFSLYGGESFYLTAQQIVNNIPPAMASNYTGWRASDGGSKNRNRYWMNENLLNGKLKALRGGWYNYHIKGLDLMVNNPEKSRATILAALEELEKANNAYFSSMWVQMFVTCKRDELIEMWKQGTKPQRERVYQILTKIDPANTSRYREIGV